MQMRFVGEFARLTPQFFRNCKVLDVGALDINGSVRKFFRNCSYLGIDVGPGPGVDLVCQGQDYRGSDESFDTVVSCECFEHNPYWRETFQNMVRVCKPGGLVLMSCGSVGRAEHGTARTTPNASPNTVAEGWDYYGNLSEKLLSVAFPLDEWFAGYGLWTNWWMYDLYFAGIKRGGPNEALHRTLWTSIEPEITRWVRSEDGIVPARRLKEIVAKLFGDRGFSAARRVRNLFPRSV